MANFLETMIVKHLKPYFLEESPGAAYLSGSKPPSVRRMEEMLKTHRFSDLLPYEAYDEDYQLFFNTDSYGFMIEISTAVGLDEELLGILTGMFNDDSIDEDTVIQHCLYASPDVMPYLTRWANSFVADTQEEGEHGV